MMQLINGQLMAVALDEDMRTPRPRLIGLQMHTARRSRSNNATCSIES